MARVLLINPPWFNPNVSCIALGTLQPLLQRAGIEVDTLHANLMFPRSHFDPIFIEHFAGLYFVPHTYPDVDMPALIGKVVDWYFDDLNQYGVLADDKEANASGFGVKRSDVSRMVEIEVARAGVCLERCMAHIAAGDYDVIGFSLTFETQLPAAVALSRRIRQLRPQAKIAWGGAACFEVQADALVRSFDCVDVVCHTEGDDVVVPLVRALRGEAPLASVPGIAYRGADGEVVHQKSPPLLYDLDKLPMPEYDDYFAAFAASEWNDTKPRLMFETARGCWWGEKHLCTYCGLNGEGLAFRAKSAERSFDEIRHLYERYPQAEIMQSADNILEMSFFQTVLPRLARMPRQPGRPLRLFYEVKSNLKAPHLALLAAAGITAVQPGIESFDDDILRLMDKGCTGLGQVQFVKWADQEGVQPVYQMLICNPGESAESYARLIDLLPYLTHLPPPGAVTKTQVERFSPLYDRAADFGIQNLRPKPHYQALYPAPGIDLMGLSYQFDYDHADHRDPALAAAHREFALEILRWQRRYKPWRLYWVERGAGAVIVDQRRGREHTEVLAPAATEVFRYLDQPRTRARLATHFPDLEPGFIDGLLERWQHRRWVYQSPQGELLATVPLRHEGARDTCKVIAAAAKRREPKARPVAPTPERRLPVLTG